MDTASMQVTNPVERSLMCHLMNEALYHIILFVYNMFYVCIACHTRDGNYKCDLCSYSSNSKTHVTRHRAKDHSEPMASTKARDPDGTFRCDECKYATPYKILYSRHASCHTNPATFKCDLCSFSYDSKRTVNRHRRSHHDEPPPVPVVEVKRPVSQPRTTPREKPVSTSKERDNRNMYSCDECNYSTPNKQVYDTHAACHSRKKASTCDLCSFSSDNKGILN